MTANTQIKCVSRICGLIKRDKNRSLQRKICLSATFRPQISHVLTRDRSPTPTVSR
jgi:hypothetical protein